MNSLLERLGVPMVQIGAAVPKFSGVNFTFCRNGDLAGLDLHAIHARFAPLAKLVQRHAIGCPARHWEW